MKLITNNPMVRDYFENISKISVQFIDGNYKDVLETVRDLVHENYEILTHPLSGSVKPNETPYKSVAVESSDSLDVQSLELIENAINTYSKLQKDKETPNWIPRVLDDFAVIDLDLIKNALRK
ncbi:MAG: GrdX family protein [Filifactoraceae bacterium]